MVVKLHAAETVWRVYKLCSALLNGAKEVKPAALGYPVRACRALICRESRISAVDVLYRPHAVVAFAADHCFIIYKQTSI